MERRYYFRLTLKYEDKTPILNIRPVTFFHNLIPYPINFRELNVPIIVNRFSEDSFDTEYILDFENSFTETGENYGETYSHRKNLRRILNDLVRISDKDVRRALNGEINLKGKRFSFKSDNGLNVDENFYFRKRGRFRCGGKKAIILNRP